MTQEFFLRVLRSFFEVDACSALGTGFDYLVCILKESETFVPDSFLLVIYIL